MTPARQAFAQRFIGIFNERFTAVGEFPIVEPRAENRRKPLQENDLKFAINKVKNCLKFGQCLQEEIENLRPLLSRCDMPLCLQISLKKQE